MDDRPQPAATPQAGPPPPSDAELITLAVARPLPGITSQARWLRIAAAGRLAGARLRSCRASLPTAPARRRAADPPGAVLAGDAALPLVG